MDVNVKGLDEELVRRLAEQAEAEGVSAQEWMRRALARTASLLTPTELAARVAERETVSQDRYDAVMAVVTARRLRGTEEAVRDARRRRR